MSQQEGVMRMATNGQVTDKLDTVTEESLIFLTKAFRGAVRLEEVENRQLLSAATSMVGAWSRWQATQSARQQTAVILANTLARENGGKVSDYLPAEYKPVPMIEGPSS